MRNEDVIESIRRARTYLETAIESCHIMKNQDGENSVAYRIAANDLETANTEVVKTLLSLQKLTDTGTDLEDLKLSVRTWRLLKREGIDTIEQLIKKTPNEITRIRGMGARSYNEIIDALEARGLELRRY